MIKKTYHTVQNSYNDCGIASLGTLLNYYGHNYPIDYLRDFVNYKKQYSLQDLLYILEKLGIQNAKVYEMKKDKINKIINMIDKPFLALIKKGDSGHFVVVHKIKKNRVLISDPNQNSATKIKKEDFLKNFTGYILLIDSKIIHTNTQNPFKLIFKKLLLHQKLKISSVLFLSLLSVLLTVISSLYFKIVIDGIIPMNLDNLLTYITYAFLIIAFIKGLTEYFRNIIATKINLLSEEKITNLFNAKLLKLPLSFYKNRENGDIFSRYIDALNIKDVISNNIIGSSIDIIIILSISIALFVLNKSIFLIICVFYILVLSITYLLSELTYKNSKKTIESQSEIYSFFMEQLNNMQIIKVLQSNDFSNNKFKKLYGIKIKNNLREIIVSNISNFLKSLLSGLFSIIIIWLGTKQIFNDSITLGTLVMIIGLSNLLLPSLDRLINNYLTIKKMIVSFHRFSALINYPEEDEFEGDHLSYINTIQFTKFSYKTHSSNHLFQNINLTINKTDKLLILGESGSGKTTFAQCLAKLKKIDNSMIYINGIDINQINSQMLRKKIIYLDENPYLYKGTIRENLQLDNEIPIHIINNVCAQCQILDFIEKIGGYDYIINENSSNLSAGQKQRIALARAVLKQPELLILDEALCNVDPDNLKKIESELLKLPSTIIFITHNSNNLKHIEKKYVLSDKSLHLFNHENHK